MTLIAHSHTCHAPLNGPMRLNAALRADPSRTTMVRARFVGDVNRRFRALKKIIRTSILDNDCFGIQTDRPRVLGVTTREMYDLIPLPEKAFEFAHDQMKIANFMEWLRKQEDAGILQMVRRPHFARDASGPWSDIYIDSAYQRGIRNSDSWLRRAKAGGSVSAQLPGGVRQAMSQPIHAQKVAMIYSRTYEDLKTVTAVMNGEIRRQITEGLTTGLAQGIAQGKNARTIARELYRDVANRVDKIGIARARTIARTEVMNAHNEAAMTEYQMAERAIGQPIMLDVSLGANPCEMCVDLEAGGPYERTQAMGQLPAHPNCVCVHMPAELKGGR